jgi:hypothetical protein
MGEVRVQRKWPGEVTALARSSNFARYDLRAETALGNVVPMEILRRPAVGKGDPEAVAIRLRRSAPDRRFKDPSAKQKDRPKAAVHEVMGRGPKQP